MIEASAIGRQAVWLAFVGGVVGLGAGPAFGATETVVYAFNPAVAANPVAPLGTVLVDAQGTIHGTTTHGGTTGNGTEYRLTASGSLAVVYSFTRTSSFPWGGLVADAAGNLYGAALGNDHDSNGSVFETSAAGRTEVEGLPGYPAPYSPTNALISDHHGSLAGISDGGGDLNEGTLYKVTPAGAISTVFSYGDVGAAIGGPAYGALASDASGNFYGVTNTSSSNPGALYRVSAGGTLTVLHSFLAEAGVSVIPNGALAIDRAGNLYGTTIGGGAAGEGSVYEYSAAGVFSVLYSFPDTYPATYPNGGLLRDTAGNLYGTTQFGGAFSEGSVYELRSSGVATTLYSFSGGSDGGDPTDGVTMDATGNLYGVTMYDGLYKNGVVYKITR